MLWTVLEAPVVAQTHQSVLITHNFLDMCPPPSPTHHPTLFPTSNPYMSSWVPGQELTLLRSMSSLTRYSLKDFNTEMPLPIHLDTCHHTKQKAHVWQMLVRWESTGTHMQMKMWEGKWVSIVENNMAPPPKS